MSSAGLTGDPELDSMPLECLADVVNLLILPKAIKERVWAACRAAGIKVPADKPPLDKTTEAYKKRQADFEKMKREFAEREHRLATAVKVRGYIDGNILKVVHIQ